jgi:hypothetical protein
MGRFLFVGMKPAHSKFINAAADFDFKNGLRVFAFFAFDFPKVFRPNGRTQTV